MGDLRTLCPTMVGRASALASIGKAVAAVRVGAGPTILIAGEAGIGKSRILAEARSLAQGLGLAVVQGSCFEPDRTVPYAPVLDVLDVASAIKVVEPTSQPGALDHELLGRIPEFALLLPDLASMPPSEPGQEQRQLFRALTRFLQRLASQQPMMIAVEDVHWSDDASLAFFGHFAREISGQPILLVLTYRSEEMGPELQHLLAAMDRQRLAVELQLDPLTRDETRDMLQAILGTDRQVPPALLEMIHSLTEGNPFFVEEVLKSLVGSGDIGQLDMSGDLEGHVPIPRTVQDAVQRRTDQLPRATRETLALAAVAGRRFDFELLAALERGDEQELLKEMRELIGAQLVVEVSADQFAFRHALTRHAIYSDLLARERRSLHGRVAEAIERGFRDSLDRYRADLARHFFAAGMWDKAFEQARLAGKQAVDLYAPQAAIEHFTCALAAASHLGMTAPIDIVRARGQAHETLGDFDNGRADLEETLRLARTAGDRQGEWRALLDLGELWASRDFARSGQYCERALDLARAMDEPAAQARSLNRVGNWYVNVEQPTVGRRHHEEALTIFETLADRRGIAETVDLLGTALMCGGDLQASIASYERAATLFRVLDDRFGSSSASACSRPGPATTTSIRCCSTVPGSPARSTKARKRWRWRARSSGAPARPLCPANWG